MIGYTLGLLGVGGRRKSCLLLLALVGCAGRHVKLVTPDASPASSYTCSEKQKCEPAQVDDAAELNQSGTAFVVLPRQCQGRFQQIVVLHADSAEPQVYVTCSTREAPGPIGTTGEDAATPPSDRPSSGPIPEM